MDLNWFQKIDALNDSEMAKTDFEALRYTIYLFEDQDELPEAAREEITEDALIALHRIERVVSKYCAKQNLGPEERSWAKRNIGALKSVLNLFEKNEALSVEDREVFSDEALIAIHRFERVVHTYFKKQKLEDEKNILQLANC